MQTISDRFLEFFEHLKHSRKGFKVSDFLKEIGIGSSMMTEIRKGRARAGTDTLHNLVKSYPELNPIWLYTGSETMLRSGEVPEDLKINSHAMSRQKMKEFFMRLDEFMNSKGLNDAQMTAETGIANGLIGKARKSGSLSQENISKILETYQDLNANWLLTGNGSMFREDEKKYSHPAIYQDGEPTDEPPVSYVPLLPISALGGTLTDFSTSVKPYECEQIISPIIGADLAITIRGESMEPGYPNGSKVFIKKIDPKAFIAWGEAYVLDTRNGTILKYVTKSQQDGFITCESENKDPKYSSFEISMDDVFGIYKVMLCMSIK